MTISGTQEPDSEPKSRLKIGSNVVKAGIAAALVGFISDGERPAVMCKERTLVIS